MERLTEEIQIGPWASLKNKAEAKVGAFADYDCLMAHMEAVTRLKAYEDTGYSPNDFDNLCREMSDLRMAIGLKSYEELKAAIRAGRVMVLMGGDGGAGANAGYGGRGSTLEWPRNISREGSEAALVTDKDVGSKDQTCSTCAFWRKEEE